MQFKYRLAIPKIKCGITSTGFLVKENIVITALHAIGSYLKGEVKKIEVLFITEDGKEKKRLATPILTKDEQWKDFQIIALKILNPIKGIEPLECVNYKFSSPMDCFTYGYPAVRARKGTPIDLEVRGEFKINSSSQDSWNLDLKTKDAIKDYKGCSGGPLLLKDSVVGVVLEQSSENQEATRLCAMSLYIYKQYLEDIGIAIRENDYDVDYKDYLVLTKQFLNTQLANNLNRRIEDNSTTSLGFSIKVETKAGMKEPYNFIHLLENENFSIVLSEPGGGKSYLLMMLMLEIIENPTLSIPKVPILLKAKNWYRDYKSIVQGIKKELLLSSPGIKDERVIEGLTTGKFILLIDGLDEVVSYKDLFVEQIKQISQFQHLKVIITCREQNYHGEFYNLFSKYSLKPLTNEQIGEYISMVFEEDISHSIIEYLRESIKDLIKNPLFLYMTTQIMKNTPDKKIPKNRSELYNEFIGYLMENRFLQNGIVDIAEFELNLKCEILAEYAYLNFRKLESTTAFREVAKSYISPDEYSKLKKELLKTGILVEERNKIDFFHPSFEEYFVALKVSKMSEDEMSNYIQKHHSKEAYIEVFKFVSGLLRYSKQQNFFLNNVEKINLFLYRQCLESRFNFENSLQEQWSQNHLKGYFERIRKSYLTIVDKFFANIKSELYPWIEKGKDLPNENISIIGSLDIKSLSLFLELSISENSDPVIIREDIKSPLLSSINTDGTPINVPTIFFEKKSNWYIDLKATDLGLDSAREVALYIVKEQLKQLIDNQGLLICESPESVIPCIEYMLSCLPVEQFYIRNKDLKEKLSLYEHSVDSIVEKLCSEDKIIRYIESMEDYGYSTKGYVSSMFYALLKFWKAKINFGEYLLPKPDLEPRDDVRTSYSFLALWSKEQFERRLSVFFEGYQIAYRNLVEKGFPSLGKYMPYYSRGPFEYGIGYDRSEGIEGTITYVWRPLKSIEESLVEDRNEEEEPIYNELSYKPKQSGKTKWSDFSGSVTPLKKVIVDDRELRTKVYEELLRDFKFLFGEF